MDNELNNNLSNELNKEITTNNIKAPNNDLELLKTHFPHCFDKNGNFQLEKFTDNLTQKEINFSSESYGLDWLGKSYARLLASDPATTLLKEDQIHNQNNPNAQNLLIKGDNLEVLKHLANAYHQKIKMIYIDPPYNTGSDGFVYADDRKFTAKELQELTGINEDKAKKIIQFTKSKSNSHSAWLTFMYPRLYIAKQLLKDDGVIFVSIDDNEVAQLRLLMDDVFGEENFVAEIIWHSKYTTSNDAKYMSNQHETILFYSKNKGNFDVGLLDRTEKQDKDYKNRDNDIKGAWKATPIHAKSGSENNIYNITFANGISWTSPNGRYPRYSKQRLQELYDTNELFFNSKGGIDKKTYLSEVKDGLTAGTLWSYTEVGHTHSNNEELAFLIGKGMFDNPKGTKLIIQMLKIANSNSHDLILDFFAGSGTTADAVMQLNADDKGNRKFILVQLAEEIDAKKNKVAFDFVKNELNASPTIFEITKERLKRAAKKINEEIATKNVGLDAQIKKLLLELQTEETKAKISHLETEISKNNVLKTQNSFRVFETMPIWEDYSFEAQELDEQIKLFGEDKLTEEDLKALLTTWKTNDGISLTEDLEYVDLGGYVAYYGNKRLYLMHKGFSADTLKVLLEKVDADENFEPRSIIAFGYHFDSANLRQLQENTKSYANKKSIDFEFVTRY